MPFLLLCVNLRSATLAKGSTVARKRVTCSSGFGLPGGSSARRGAGQHPTLQAGRLVDKMRIMARVQEVSAKELVGVKAERAFFEVSIMVLWVLPSVRESPMIPMGVVVVMMELLHCGQTLLV